MENPRSLKSRCNILRFLKSVFVPVGDSLDEL